MTEAFELFWGNLRWMGWNLFLAIIPCALSFILFSKRSPKRLSRNPIWWIGFLLFVLFLPNAPYIITDIIHFVNEVRLPDISANGIIFVMIPQYLIFILLGFQCYAISLVKLMQYLEWVKLLKNVVWLEVSINLICAIGVYWGRVNRLNSWDVFTQPSQVMEDALKNLENPNFFLGTGIFFIIFTCLYYIFKWVNIAIAFYWQKSSKSISV
ncbi:DUF1361 domain-containing protein [Pseudanabaena mucicola]|uniref:DUF1361 domain-containing protein n=1 Tax=Pseudanabaena mucicola FACHB-723 TaxID=2692860 RepID=A0ABR7ZU97_9CYAN|nr:DUF1361 domain-containing protein [Pseudanabaena mucicola]MBD2187372.1 DUF1361 domain-containing protein [Pseudanabaena mucicola FACHB-723]